MKAKAPNTPRAARAGAIGFTVLALALTALTAFLLSRVFGEGKYATEPLEDVVVAARELPTAQIIREDDIKVVQWPKSTIPDSAIRNRDKILGPNPRVPVVTILPGEAIVEQRLASPEAGTGMASRVPQDMRGFPIRVEAWIADARLVYPGAVVDVLATMSDPVERTPITLTVLQHLTVLAVNGHLDAGGGARTGNGGDQNDRRSDGAVVTVLVTPGEAEVLALAAREGKLDLALRNANDNESVTTQGTNPFLLLGRPFPGSPTSSMAGNVPAPIPPAPRRQLPTRAEMRRAAAAEASGNPEAAMAPEPAGSVQTIRIGGK